jgi:hypothetical protein
LVIGTKELRLNWWFIRFDYEAGGREFKMKNVFKNRFKKRFSIRPGLVHIFRQARLQAQPENQTAS